MSPATTVPVTICPLALEQVQTDAGAQARARLRQAVVRQYAEALAVQKSQGELRFPPIIVFSDGQSHWLGDGCHRVEAARLAGLNEFPAEVRPGSRRDALLYSISANGTHGLPPSNADKRHAVALLLADAEWSQWSDREIARRCQTTHNVVRRLRQSASGTTFQMKETLASASGTTFQMKEKSASAPRRRKVQRGGKVYEMDVPDTREQGTDSAADQKSVPAEHVRTPALAVVAPVDALGILLPDGKAPVFASAPAFQRARDLFSQLARVLDEIAQSPGGELYRLDMVRTAHDGLICPGLRASLNKLADAEPYCCYCPICQASESRANPRCRTCSGRGWVPQATFERCSPGAREEVLKRRPRNAG